MSWFRGGLFEARSTAELDADARPSQVTDRIGVARRLSVELKAAVNQVGIEEFYGQEAQFDEDSRLGRELLYLASNDEWIRATREIVTFEAADMLDTRIQVHVDLDRITHEAFRERDERIWLPLVVLAPPRVEDDDSPGSGHVRPSPTVLDSAGNVVPSLPESEARRWVAAAMAEIVLNMIPPALGGESIGALGSLAREQRLLLSAAIYRVLRDGGEAGNPGQGIAAPVEDGERLRRVQRARARLSDMFDWIGLHLHDPDAAGGTQRDGLMIRRAAHVLHALRSPTTLVVVAHSPTTESAVFSVDLPGRPLVADARGGWRQSWRRRAHGPTARADVDILLPGMDAEHAVQVNLPEGVSLARDRDPAEAPLRATVRVDRPRCLRHIDDLMDQLTPDEKDSGQDRKPGHEDPVAQCLVDFTLARIDVATDAFRHYFSADSTSVNGLPAWLSGLRAALREVRRGGAVAEAGRDAVRAQRGSGARPEDERLYRIVASDSHSPRRGHVWLPAVENRNVRATPITARFGLDVVSDGSAPLRTARYSGFLSLVLLGAVLVYVLAELYVTHTRLEIDGQVLGSVLTLFAAIQASRIRPPDKAALRGMLIASHTWVIVASILPAVLLGVSLAFEQAPVWAVVAAFCVQLGLQVTMYSPWLTGLGRRPADGGLVLRTGVALDYPRVDVLRASWWRSTTAGALLLGANAHGYVIRQDGGTVLELLARADRRVGRQTRERGVLRGRGLLLARPAPDSPANILAMLRAGTAERTLSFVVFREEPTQEWQAGRVPVELDVDRLIVHEAPVGNVDLYLGMEAGHFPELDGHPIMRLLEVAQKRELLVLDVQQPVPPPHGGDPRRLWSRTRIGLRGDEVRNLAGLLTESLAAIRQTTGPAVDLLVDMSTQTPPRRFLGNADDVPARVLVPADLDVVRLAGAGAANGRGGGAGARWFSSVLTDYALAGTERDLLRQLSRRHPGLRLSGITAARLHGVSVLLVLAHQATTGAEPAAEAGESSNGRVAVLLDGLQPRVARWNAAKELGQLAPGGVLLQVHARYSDRPGIFAALVETIGRGLAQTTGNAYAAGSLHVTYLQTEVADGRNAVVKFMIRLPAPATPAALPPAALQRVEKAARQVLVAQAHADPGTDDLGLMRVPRAMVRIVVLGADPADSESESEAEPDGPAGSAGSEPSSAPTG